MTQKFDASSEKKLATVRPELQKVARRALELSRMPFAIVQGARTQREQDALYAQGRTRKGPIVTWTRNSKHIGGHAVDFAALDARGKISWDERLYPAIGKSFKQAASELKTAIAWGGDWRSKDWGHVQLAPSKEPVVSPAPPQRFAPQGLRTSLQGRVHLKEFEGVMLEAHQVDGIWHIGVGHSETSGRPPIPVRGLKITLAEADAILASDLKAFEQLIAETVTVPLTQGQFDALVSIGFNKGGTWFRQSELLKRVNAQDWKGATEAILAAVPAPDHKFHRGLKRRRDAEAALFNSVHGA